MSKKSKLWRRFHLSLIFAIIVFAIMFATMVIVAIGMHFFSRLGFDSEDHYLSIVIFAFASLIVGVILSVTVAKVPLKPLYELINATNKIASGDYSPRINLKGPCEIRQLSKSFNNMAEELQSVEMLRGDFVNNFAHEFKTPIVSIRGFAKMLKRQDLTMEERDEYLDIIISESDRLTELAMNVLNLCNIEKQTILTNKTKINVSEQIRLAIALLDCKWSYKNIDIDFECGEKYIQGNEKLLKQVWINILDNAMKFTNEGEKVSVDIKTIEDKLYFYIKDNGSGMTEEEAKCIFDKFYQGDTSHTTKGNGLGLTIAKRIVELYNGIIRVKETNGFGTTFEIIIPK